VTAASLPPWVDDMRTRVYFLGALSSGRRDAFLAEAIEEMRAHLRELRASADGDAFERLALEGAARQLEVRLAWMEDLRRAATAHDGASRRPRRSRAARRKG
jgi:hypothetical protein